MPWGVLLVCLFGAFVPGRAANCRKVPCEFNSNCTDVQGCGVCGLGGFCYSADVSCGKACQSSFSCRGKCNYCEHGHCTEPRSYCRRTCTYNTDCSGETGGVCNFCNYHSRMCATNYTVCGLNCARDTDCTGTCPYCSKRGGGVCQATKPAPQCGNVCPSGNGGCDFNASCTTCLQEPEKDYLTCLAPSHFCGLSCAAGGSCGSHPGHKPVHGECSTCVEFPHGSFCVGPDSNCQKNCTGPADCAGSDCPFCSKYTGKCVKTSCGSLCNAPADCVAGGNPGDGCRNCSESSGTCVNLSPPAPIPAPVPIWAPAPIRPPVPIWAPVPIRPPVHVPILPPLGRWSHPGEVAIIEDDKEQGDQRGE